MRSSIEIAKEIERILDKKDMKATELAKRIGVDRSTITRYLNGSRKISMEDLPKIASALGVTPYDLLFEEEKVKPTNIIPVTSTVKIPILGSIACGEPIYVEENFSGYRTESNDALPSGKLFYLEAKGNSMEPTIPNGSFVLIREQSDVEYGEIAAVLVNGNTEATLKRVKKQRNVIMLMPDNSNYEPYIVTKDNPAKILGKAIRFTQDL